MIISPVVGAFFTKYKLLFQVLAVLLAIIVIMILWNRFVAEPYRDQGRAEIQAKWDKHEKDLALQHAENIKAAVEVERSRAKAVELSAHKRIKDIQNEKADLEASLDTERRTNKRLRTITGKPVTGTGGMLRLPESEPGSDATCEARLPAEIGEGFERLREAALRIGSEANTAAIILGNSQETHRINGGSVGDVQ